MISSNNITNIKTSKNSVQLGGYKGIIIGSLDINIPFAITSRDEIISDIYENIEDIVNKVSSYSDRDEDRFWIDVPSFKKKGYDSKIIIKFLVNLDSEKLSLKEIRDEKWYSYIIDYCLQKMLILDSFLNYFITLPEYRLFGLQKKLNFKFSELIKVESSCPDARAPRRIQNTGNNVVDKKNQQLCISPYNTFDSYRIFIQNMVANNSTIVVTAGTGLGKTTRLPIYLLEILTLPGQLGQFEIRKLNATKDAVWEKSNSDGIYIDEVSNNSMILCALPKNVLVSSNGENPVILNAIGQYNRRGNDDNNYYNGAPIIGFLKRGGDVANCGNYLNFMTAGLLNTKFNRDPSLSNFECVINGNIVKKNISCVIVDEAHERTMDIDILLRNLKKVLELKPSFKIVIMSATIKACLFREYFFGNAVNFYGGGDGEEYGYWCHETEGYPEIFERYNKYHVEIDNPIIHVDKNPDNYNEHMDELGFINAASPFPKLNTANSCSPKNDEVSVSVYYLNNTFVNQQLLSAYLLLKIFSIRFPQTSNKYFENQMGLKILDINNLFSDFPIDRDIKSVGEDIIVFVANKEQAKSIWMILSCFPRILLEYDVFYFESKSVSILIPFSSDNVKSGKWCSSKIPQSSLPYRWPKGKPAWENINLNMCREGARSDSCYNINDKDGRPQIIIATNAIESSITFRKCGIVIDNGLQNEAGYVSSLNMDTLSIQPIVKASANQRKGRTGRTASGICFRLYTEYVYESFNDSRPAEILSTNIDFKILDILRNGNNFLNYDFIESPTYNQINNLLTRFMKCKFIPEDFNIYSIYDELNWYNKERINNFINFNRYSSDPSNNELEIDLITTYIWYETYDNNLKILMAYAQWVISNPPNMFGNNRIDFPDGRNVKCSLEILYNRMIDNEEEGFFKRKFLNWIQKINNLDSLSYFHIPGYSLTKIELSDDAFLEMNKILIHFNQGCFYGYKNFTLNGEAKNICFDTNINDRWNEYFQNSDCTYIKSFYKENRYEFLFLNVI